MKRSGIEVFSTSFLDLLSCGMAAVIVLCFVFAAMGAKEGEVAGDVVVATIESSAEIGVIITTSTGDKFAAGIGPRVSSPFVVSPWQVGARKFTLLINEAQITGGETVEVFVSDSSALRTNPSGEVLVRYSVLAPGSVPFEEPLSRIVLKSPTPHRISKLIGNK